MQFPSGSLQKKIPDFKVSTTDHRYRKIKVLIESGHIKTFSEIFENIPKTVVYKDLCVNFKRFSKAIECPSLFEVRELMALAQMFGIDEKELIDFAWAQIEIFRKQHKPKKATKK